MLQALIAHFGDIPALLAASIDDISRVDKMGAVTAAAVHGGLASSQQTLRQLREAEVAAVLPRAASAASASQSSTGSAPSAGVGAAAAASPSSDAGKAALPFAGAVVVPSGTFSRVSRGDVERLAVQAGAKYVADGESFLLTLADLHALVQTRVDGQQEDQVPGCRRKSRPHQAAKGAAAWCPRSKRGGVPGVHRAQAEQLRLACKSLNQICFSSFAIHKHVSVATLGEPVKWRITVAYGSDHAV